MIDPAITKGVMQRPYVVMPKEMMPTYERGTDVSEHYDASSWLDSMPSLAVDLNGIGHLDFVMANALKGTSDGGAVANYNAALVERTLGQEIFLRSETSTNASLQLKPGKIAYDVPTDMRVGAHYTVEVRVIGGRSDTLLLIGVSEQNYLVEDLPISDVAGARLIDPAAGSNFTITALSSERQPVDSILPTIWKWDVVPKRPGQHTLELILLAYVSIADDVVRDIPVFDREVVVTTTWYYSAWELFKQYWQWFTTVLIIPLFLWVRSRWKTWFGKKKD